MPISIYDAHDFPIKDTGYVYSLCFPDDGSIFYVGKTRDRNNRLIVHLSDAKSETRGNTKKGKIIKSLLDAGKSPCMDIIETHEIRTHYDKLYYDYREFYFIRSFLENGVGLTNIRIKDILSSEIRYKKIISDAKSGVGLSPSDFYYRNDEKGFPIYDLKKMDELGYRFSKNQYASHWSYIINLAKYEKIEDAKLAYVYNDIKDEHNYNPNWADGLW